MVEEVGGELGDCCEILGGEAGMHLTVSIGERLRDTEIAAKAVQRKLWLSALSPSYGGSSPRQGFVLGFGNTSAAEIPAAVRLLRATMTRAEAGQARVCRLRPLPSHRPQLPAGRENRPTHTQRQKQQLIAASG